MFEGLLIGLNAQVTARPDALVRDLTEAMTEVCLPAQRSERGTRDVVDTYEGNLMLMPQRFNDRARTDAWRVSEDGRVTVFANEKGCAASAYVRGEDVRILSQVREALAALSVRVEPRGENRKAAAWTYCVAYEDGTLGSFDLYTEMERTEPPLGRRVPIKTRSLTLFAPTEPGCEPN